MDLDINEGKVINQDGKPVAIYKDSSGNIHSISAICTHMSCTVGWNNQEKTWDCPCHGSRFDANGKVIKGPAIKNLSNVELTK